jgi:flagellar M-ring protein FliF
VAGLRLDAVRSNVTSSFQRMTGPQRLTLGLAFAATVTGMFAMSRLTGGTTMGTLYADLEPEAAAAIVDQLDAQAVPFELSDGGRVIQVPAEQVDALRLDLSAQGLPSSGEGWSILDSQGITTSEFDQRVGYQRAMEGELAKTISAIDGVAEADVHLVIPEEDLFAGDDVKASASVLLISGGSQVISPMQVEAIVNLVASSVKGMTPDQVSVTDEAGRILAAPGEGSAVIGLEGDSQIRAQREYEAGIENDLEKLLATVVGPGLAVVNVTADLDFDTVETVTEQYEPIKSADGAQTVLNETTRDELYRDAAAATQTGVLGIETPDPATLASSAAAGTGTGTAADASVKYSLGERDATYAMNKVVTNAERAPGEVKSLSVAVLLDETAIDAARLAEVEQLVTAAAGVNAERGDTLAVSLLPINEKVRTTIEANTTPVEPEAAGMDIIALARTAGTVIVALVVIVLGLRYVGKGGQRQVLESMALQELGDGGDSNGARLALESGDKDEDEQPAIAAPEIRLQGLIANQPEDVAGMLRSWLSEAEEVR